MEEQAHSLLLNCEEVLKVWLSELQEEGRDYVIQTDAYPVCLHCLLFEIQQELERWRNEMDEV